MERVSEGSQALCLHRLTPTPIACLRRLRTVEEWPLCSLGHDHVHLDAHCRGGISQGCARQAVIGKRVSVGDGATDYHSLPQSLPESEQQMNASLQAQTPLIPGSQKRKRDGGLGGGQRAAQPTEMGVRLSRRQWLFQHHERDASLSLLTLHPRLSYFGI